MPASTHADVRSDTRSITIDSTPAHVFDFVADPTNLPKWAVGFCRSIRREGDRWIVETAHGDVPIRLSTHRDLGIIDFFFSPAPGVELAAYSRVVPSGEGGAAYSFTQFQAPGMSEAVFEGQVKALVEELLALRSLIHARAACPA